MDDDDEMIVIIVGDQSEDYHPTLAMSNAIPIKEEPVDELEQSDLNPESILETAKLHGEYIGLKKEEYNVEYLEDDILQKEINPNHKDAADSSSSSKKLKSYIYQLRKNFPKMRKDENYLIAHLADAMRNTKAPPPPTGFCVEFMGIYACKYCNAENINLPSACRHYQKKHGSRVFVCFACGANYKCTTGLYKHEKRCQAPGANLVLKARGQYLGRKGRQRPYLTRNKFDPNPTTSSSSEAKEGTQSRFFCSYCPASFKYKDALKSHLYLHKGIRPFQCEECPMAYTTNVALKRHLMLHTDVEFICDTCKRSFKAKNTLITHMNTHLPQRKYPCDQCERRFAQKYALRNHISRDHWNIPPPFACAACPKRFPRFSNLKAHMKARHAMTLMSRNSFMKGLQFMSKDGLNDATIAFNQRHNNNPECNNYDFITDEGTRSNLVNASDGEVVVEIVPVRTDGKDIKGSPQREETQDELVSEDIVQEPEEEDIPLTNKSSNNEKKAKPKIPRIDLSFVAKRKEKLFIDRAIHRVNFRDMPVLIAEENADVSNYMVVEGNACEKDIIKVNEEETKPHRRKVKKSRCTVVMKTNDGKTIFTTHT